MKAILGVASSAALFVAAFPPLSIWPAMLLAVAPLAWALDRAPSGRVFLLGWLHGALFGWGVAHWLVEPLTAEYGVATLSAWVVAGVVVLGYAAVHGAGLALGLRLASRAGSWVAPLALASVLALAEWVRGELLGLPWLLAAHAVARVPLLIQTAEIGGVPLVSAVVLVPGAGLGLALARRQLAPLAAGCVVLAAAVGLGVWLLPESSLGKADQTLDVLVVQAAVRPSERFTPGSAWRNTMHHVEITRRAALGNPPDLIVWSETSVDDELGDRRLLRALTDLADEIGAPLVTGAPQTLDGVRRNVVALVEPRTGLAATYAKQRLVPFSEYDPAWGAPLAPLLGPVTKGLGYEPGHEAKVFRSPVPFASPICFEITYPNLVRTFRLNGARLLLNLSNDAWFGRTGYAELHLRHALLRAVEQRIWVVRGANTGISALVDPAGRVTAELGVFEEGTLRGKVATTQRETLYARFGDGPVLLLLSAVGLLAVRAKKAG